MEKKSYLSSKNSAWKRGEVEVAGTRGELLLGD